MESQNEVFTAKTQDTDIQKAINQIILFWNIVLGLLTAIVSPAIMMA